MSEKTPAVFQSVLGKILPDQDKESLLGDYEELHKEVRKSYGSTAAHAWYVYQIMKLIPVFLRIQIYYGTTLFANYVKIALRNIARYKLYSAINIFGLSAGIAFCILIFLYVKSEMTYDTFHENKDHIYRVLRVDKNPDGSIRRYRGGLPMPVGPALVKEIPAVIKSRRFIKISSWVKSGELVLNEGLTFADPALFDIFSFNMLAKSAQNPLSDFNSVVLSKNMAEKIYGNTDVSGKVLSVKIDDEFRDFSITGILENIPENSSIQFDIIINFHTIEHSALYAESANNWRSNNSSVFILLDKNVLESDAGFAFNDFAKSHWDDSPGLNLQKLTNVHLDTHVGASIEAISNPIYSYILIAIGSFILLISCINYITLSIGRSSTRFREIGMRKVLGAVQNNLVKQFLSEALLISFFSMLCGLLIAQLLIPSFSSLAGKNLELDIFENLSTLVAVFSLSVLTGLLAGCYPALLLARSKPIDIFRGKYKVSGKNIISRILLMVQFSISIVLIIGTLFMLQQVDYVRSSDLGFDSDQVIEIPVYETFDGEKVLEYFKDSAVRYPHILNVSGSSGGFTRFRSRSYIYTEEKNILFYHYKIDENYIETLNINLIDGSNFSTGHSSTVNTRVLINERLKKELNWDSAVGRSLPGMDNMVITGVVSNYHNISLHNEIPAVILYYDPEQKARFMYVKLEKESIQDGLVTLEDIWNQYISDIPFTFSFLDEEINQQYNNEIRWSKIIGYSSIAAIFLACLGLFGLSSIIISKRFKEIGIRKVHGARLPDIVGLIGKEFIYLALAANLIAWPAGYFAVKKWFEIFAYRINIDVTTFIVSTAAVALMSLVIVSTQTIKAGMTNPVKTLRHE